MVNLDSHEKLFLELEEQQQLSLGYFVTDEITTYFARQKFMLVISLEVPECIDSLKRILLNNYTLMDALIKKAQHKYPSLSKILQYEEGNKLYEFLINWSNDWNINEEWIIDIALVAINSWFNNKDLLDQIYWYNNPVKFEHAIQRAVQIIARMEKDPEYPKRPDEYRPLIHKSKKEYSKLQDEYMEKVNSFYEKNGFKKAIIKKEDPQRHFRWLMQYQLLKMKPESIIKDFIKRNPSKEKKLSIDSVKKEIRNAADLIGLKILKL